MTDTSYLKALGELIFYIALLASVPSIYAAVFTGEDNYPKWKKNLVIYGWPVVFCLILDYIYPPSGILDFVLGLAAVELVGAVAGGLSYEWIEKKKINKRKSEERTRARMQELYEEIDSLKDDLKRYRQE